MEDSSIKSWNNIADDWVAHADTNDYKNIFIKRSVIGSYHQISAKHLDAYLDELEWRFNNRDNPYLFRDILLKLIQSENVSYKELTARV